MYKLIKASAMMGGDDYIQRKEDGAFITPELANADYQAYLKWLEEGNTLDPAGPIVPPNVTKIFKLSLVRYFEQIGMLETFIAYLESSPITKFKWDSAASLDISDPLVIEAGTALGFTAEQVQELFNAIGSAS